MNKKNCVDCKHYTTEWQNLFNSRLLYVCQKKNMAIDCYDLFRNECKEYERKTNKMRHDERDLERRCIDYARQHGWDCWKNENNGNKGIPDHSLLKGGRFIMVEFKASATARIRPEQIRWKERHPDVVFFCHDFEIFTKILEK